MACSKEMLQEMDDIFTCAVCLEQLTEPRQLLCLHVFCTECLKTLVKKRPTDPRLCCPTCRKYSDIPDNGVIGFPEDFRLKSLKEVRDKFQVLSTDETNAQCSVCAEDGDESAANCVCKDCVSTMCQACSKAHNKFHKGHDVVSFEGLSNVELANIIKYKPVMCTQHNEKIKYLCSCSEMICVSCAVIDHSRHQNKQEIPKVAERKRKELFETRQRLAITVVKLQEELDGATAAVLETENCVEQGIGAIQKRAKELVDSVKGFEQQSIQQLNSSGQQHIFMITSGKQGVEMSKQNKEEAIKEIDEVLKGGTDLDVIQVSLQGSSMSQPEVLTCDKVVPELETSLPQINIPQIFGSVSLRKHARRMRSKRNPGNNTSADFTAELSTMMSGDRTNLRRFSPSQQQQVFAHRDYYQQ